MAQLISPNKTLIVGTVDTILATAEINGVYRDKDGTIGFDFCGDTEVHWDTQETTTNDAGELMVTDSNGDEFPLSACKYVEDDEVDGEIEDNEEDAA